MTITLQYAFIDETGSSTISKHNDILIVVAVCTDAPQFLNRLIRKMQKKYGSSLASGELKGKKAHSKLIEEILHGLVHESVEVFSIILERQVLRRAADDPEALYSWAIMRLVRKLVVHYQRLEIVLDQRYTTRHLRYLLEKDIRAGIADLPQQYVLIRQEDSVFAKELQAADFVAWALFQKY